MGRTTADLDSKNRVSGADRPWYSHSHGAHFGRFSRGNAHPEAPSDTTASPPGGAGEQVQRRRTQARHAPRAAPGVVFATPGEAISWGITKLPRPIRGNYFDAYVVIDIYSRYIVGCAVHESECAALAAAMIMDTFALTKSVIADLFTEHRSLHFLSKLV